MLDTLLYSWFNALYNVHTFLTNSSFSNIYVLALMCDGYLGRSLITVNNCNFTIVIKNQIINGMVWLSYKNCINQVGNFSSEEMFSNCYFSNMISKEHGTLLDISLDFFMPIPHLSLQTNQVFMFFECLFEDIYNLKIMSVSYSTNRTIGVPILQ